MGMKVNYDLMMQYTMVDNCYSGMRESREIGRDGKI